MRYLLACLLSFACAVSNAQMLLKQSTAVNIPLGPFLDPTTGVPETGLTIALGDYKISKNGAAFANPNDANELNHMTLGVYELDLDTTDTNTLGILTVIAYISDAKFVRQDYLVVPANVYDSIVGGSDKLEVDSTQIEGSDATTQVAGSVWDTALASYTTATDFGGAVNWLKNAFATDGVLSAASLVNAPTGTGGGLTFKINAEQVEPEKTIYDIVQGSARTLTLIAQSTAGFTDSTPTAITVVVKDKDANTVTINNASITRLAETANFQIIRFTLSTSNTAALSAGMVSIEARFDDDRVQLTNRIRVVAGL